MNLQLRLLSSLSDSDLEKKIYELSNPREIIIDNIRENIIFLEQIPEPKCLSTLEIACIIKNPHKTTQKEFLSKFKLRLGEPTEKRYNFLCPYNSNKLNFKACPFIYIEKIIKLKNKNFCQYPNEIENLLLRINK